MNATTFVIEFNHRAGMNSLICPDFHMVCLVASQPPVRGDTVVAANSICFGNMLRRESCGFI